MIAATLTAPKPPTQEEAELKHGYTLDPFQPLWVGTNPEGIGSLLYQLAQSIDRVGNQYDWIEDFDDHTEQVRQGLFGWYEVALKAFKIKLFKAYRQKFKSFRQWCEEALGCTVAAINSKIRAARVLSQLISLGFERLPQSPSVCLELSKLHWESLGDTWRDICDRYADHEITQKVVSEIIQNPTATQPKFKKANIATEKWERLSEIAAQAGLSPSKLLDQLLDDYLETPDADDQLPDVDQVEAFSQIEPVDTNDSQGTDHTPDPLPVETEREVYSVSPDAQGTRPETRHLPTNLENPRHKKPMNNLKVGDRVTYKKYPHETFEIIELEFGQARIENGWGKEWVQIEDLQKTPELETQPMQPLGNLFKSLAQPTEKP